MEWVASWSVCGHDARVGSGARESGSTNVQSPLSVVAVRSLLPENRFEFDAVEAAFMDWLKDRPELEQAKAKRILKNSGVQTRRSCITLDEVFTPCSLTESSARYRHHAKRLGIALLDDTLQQAGIKPKDVDVLVTTSCTGYMIPSVDAYMAERLGFRTDVLRLPVTEMGCAAGASAMMYASEMLRGRSEGIAAVVNIELPTNTMQHHDFSMDNIVSSALFSDGLGCAILRKGARPGIASIKSWITHQVPETLELLGYNLTSGGFLMNLHPTLPDVIGQNFEAATDALLKPEGLSLSDIRHFVIHPGGVKILDRIEPILAKYGGSTQLSRDTMRDCGNMSSATVMVILERLLKSKPQPGKVLMMSFGPGFGAHMLLLEVGKEG